MFRWGASLCKPHVVWNVLSKSHRCKNLAFFLLLFVPVLADEQKNSYSYTGAITSAESIFMATASNLRVYFNNSGRNLPVVLTEIHNTAYKLFSFEEKLNNNTWHLQPGRMKDHPDYKFAGYQENMRGYYHNPKPVEGIGTDVSHFMAIWPAVIYSFKVGSYDSVEKSAYFNGLLAGIGNQLQQRVIVQPSKEVPIFRLTNYMDGTNGLYRWNYNNRGLRDVIKPYQLSCAYMYSNLFLLNSDYIRTLYGKILATLPYDDSLELGGSGYCNSREGRLLVSLTSKVDLKAKIDISANDHENFSEFTNYLATNSSIVGNGAYSSIVGSRLIGLFSAFLIPDKKWLNVYEAHVELFFALKESSDWINTSNLHKLHYHYFLSFYLLNSAENKLSGKWQQKISDYLLDQIEKDWLHGDDIVSNPGWGEPVFHNYRDFVGWKLHLQHLKAVTRR